ARAAQGRYERNTPAVGSALADLLLHRPARTAVILRGAYALCAACIRQAKQNDFNALFLNVSFVGPSSLAKALGSDGEGVIVTQVVPPVESSLPAVNDFRAAMRARGPEGDASFGS